VSAPEGSAGCRENTRLPDEITARWSRVHEGSFAADAPGKPDLDFSLNAPKKLMAES
jgi:hypothetical protein